MSKKTQAVYVGIGNHVAALDASSGDELWRTRLKLSSFVTVLPAGDRVYAGAGGEAFCLDAGTGEILWRNKLKGLGNGLVSFGGGDAAQAAALQAQRAAAAAAS